MAKLNDELHHLDRAIALLKAKAQTFRAAQGRLGLLISGLEREAENMETVMAQIYKNMKDRENLVKRGN